MARTQSEKRRTKPQTERSSQELPVRGPAVRNQKPQFVSQNQKETGRGSALQQLARSYGVQVSYRDVSGKRRAASQETLIAVLRALGARLERLQDASEAFRMRQKEFWQRCLEPVAVSWDGRPILLKLRLPESSLDKTLSYTLRLETGEVKTKSFVPRNLSTIEIADLGAARYVAKALTLSEALPRGYHRLDLEADQKLFQTTLICAPLKCYSPEPEEKIWGLFLPLYALHTKRSWGAGDFSDMEELYEWQKELGGRMVATLPFFASFLDEPFEPGPYSPASRLFWNEFYIDLARAAQMAGYPNPSDLIGSFESEHSSDLAKLRSAPLVDYKLQMALKRKVLEELSSYFFKNQGAKKNESFLCFIEEREGAEDYARFRAVCERQEKPWPQWPEVLRKGRIQAGDYDQEIMEYHLFVQWAAKEQIHRLAESLRKTGPGLYLDLPLGVSPYAYDLWRWPELFPSGVSGGAPPDIVFTKGQDWGFPPTHPQKIREDRYRYVTDYLSSIMKQSGMLRIDHVMGLHRLYLIPRDLDASRGAYVRYPAEELYAILSVESHKNRCRIVGENLGTVPGYVNNALSRHNVLKMYVVQYELESHSPKVLPPISPGSKASLNTHDMVPFAGFLSGQDIKDRQEIGLLSEEAAKNERQSRLETRADLEGFLKRKGFIKDSATVESMMKASLSYLGASPAPIVLINIEDLWLETNAQNLPGTSKERPNWRRKARYGLEEIREMDAARKILEGIDSIRKKGRRNSRAKEKKE